MSAKYATIEKHTFDRLRFFTLLRISISSRAARATAIFVFFAISPPAWGQGRITINNAVFNWAARVSDGRTGEYLEGIAWLGQMYYSPDRNASDAVLVPVPGPAAVFGSRGLFDRSQNLERILPDVLPGTIVAAQFRAWNAAAGATFEEAAASPNGVVGKSNIGGIETGGGMGTPGDFKGIYSFSVYPVPEPGVLALGLLCCAALCWRRLHA